MGKNEIVRSCGNDERRRYERKNPIKGAGPWPKTETARVVTPKPFLKRIQFSTTGYKLHSTFDIAQVKGVANAGPFHPVQARHQARATC